MVVKDTDIPYGIGRTCKTAWSGRSFINNHNRFDFMAKADRLLGKWNGYPSRQSPHICAATQCTPQLRYSSSET